MAYQVVRYHAGLRARVVALEAHLWSGRPALDSAYFEWKYEHNPCADEPLLHVALEGDEVIGVRGWMAMRWERADTGEHTAALLGGDSVVAPAHRRRGIFRRINEAAMPDLAGLGHAFVYNLSAEPITWHTSHALGWRSPGPFRPLWRNATPGVNPVGAGRRRALEADERLWLSETARPEAMSALLRRSATGACLRTPAEPGWLAWRLRNPGSLYRYVYWEDGGLEGFAILQRSAGRAKGDVRLAGLAASGPEVLIDLLDSVLSLSHANALIAWGASLGEAAATHLLRHGCRWADDSRGVAGYRPGVLMKSLDDGRDPGDWRVLGLPALDPTSWKLDMLATDGY